jgi:hypothetical protein
LQERIIKLAAIAYESGGLRSEVQS